MEILSLVRILICLGYLESSLALRVPLEDVATWNGVPECRLRLRSHAKTNVETVWLFGGESLSFYFCLTADDEVVLSDLEYSNDGGSDVIAFVIDSDVIGEVNTTNQSSYGDLWNDFHSSGVIGKGDYSVGKHLLSLTIIDADEYGVELDTLFLNFGTNYTENGFSFCDLTNNGVFLNTRDRCHPTA